MRHVLIIILVVGCSSSDRVTSISESKTIASLSKDEAKQLCTEMTAYGKKKVSPSDTHRITCASQAIMKQDGSTNDAVRASCKKAFEECVAKPAEPPPEPDCSKAVEQMSSCKELTIGDLSGCAVEMNELMATMAKEDPCVDLVAGDSTTALTKLMERMKTPKCAALESKCDKSGAKGGDKATGKKSGPSDAEVAAKMEGFQKQMCDCKDKACADTVNEGMTKWGTEMAKTTDPDRRPDPVTAKKMAELATKYGECMTKLLTQ